MSDQACSPEIPKRESVRPPALERILARGGFVTWSATVVRLENDSLHWDLRLTVSKEMGAWVGAEAGQEAAAWTRAFHPEHRDRMRQTTVNALLGEESGYEQEFPLIGRDGSRRWMHEMVEIDPLGEGKWSLAGLVRDISKRKNAQSQLQVTKARFELIWKSSRDAMRLTDAEGTIIAVNPAFCEMTGQAEEELIGRPLGVMCVLEDREEMLRRYRDRFHQGLWEPRIERHLTLVNGRKAIFEMTLTKIESGEDTSLCFTVIRDITARREGEQALRRSEAFFRSVWEGATDGMRLTDENGFVLAVNDAYCELVGLPREEIVGEPYTVAYDESEDRLQMLENYRNTCYTRKMGGRQHSYMKLTDGRSLHLEFAFSCIEIDGSKPVFLTNLRDVTHRKQAEEKRLQLERKMLDAQRLESLGVLAGGIAHDFNNLLTAILGNAGLALLQLPEPNMARPFLNTIERTSLQAADLCNQMLSYTGRGRLEAKQIRLNSLLEEMSHLLQVSINKQIALRFHLDKTLPSIQAEQAEIQQIVMNLIINASESIGEGGGTITVSTRVVEADREFLDEAFLAPELPEGRYVSLEISDTGCGMILETQAKIFDPFFTTKFTGRGLGLAAVRGIVQRHKGTLKVYSEVQVGTTFKLLLPAVEEWSGQENETEEGARRKYSREGTVLIADDEPTVRAVMARMLEVCGLTVILAKNGKEAVEMFDQHPGEIDLVILDMTMPVLGGLETFSEIRQIKPDQKIFLMSGYTEIDVIDRFKGEELTGFLQKPFNWESLESKLREVLPD